MDQVTTTSCMSRSHSGLDSAVQTHAGIHVQAPPENNWEPQYRNAANTITIVKHLAERIETVKTDGVETSFLTIVKYDAQKKTSEELIRSGMSTELHCEHASQRHNEMQGEQHDLPRSNLKIICRAKWTELSGFRYRVNTITGLCRVHGFFLASRISNIERGQRIRSYYKK